MEYEDRHFRCKNSLHPQEIHSYSTFPLNFPKKNDIQFIINFIRRLKTVRMNQYKQPTFSNFVYCDINGQFQFDIRQLKASETQVWFSTKSEGSPPANEIRDLANNSEDLRSHKQLQK